MVWKDSSNSLYQAVQRHNSEAPQVEADCGCEKENAVRQRQVTQKNGSAALRYSKGGSPQQSGRNAGKPCTNSKRTQPTQSECRNPTPENKPCDKAENCSHGKAQQCSDSCCCKSACDSSLHKKNGCCQNHCEKSACANRNSIGGCGNQQSPLGGLFQDRDALLIGALILILIEEKADYKLILALAFVLLG